MKLDSRRSRHFNRPEPSSTTTPTPISEDDDATNPKVEQAVEAQLSPWLDELLQERKTRRGHRETEAFLAATAAAHAQGMFRRLRLQVQRDVAHYVDATANEVVCEEAPDKFVVTHPGYPFFLVEAVLVPPRSYPRNTIQCLEARKPYEGRVELYREFDIKLVAQSPDRVYYVLNGEEYDNEARVSRLLLESVFASLG
ncbi:MAG TPA: hypothetical protein VKU19_29360 [Bryobacteraceae bacterium]|nr:hypothetical protein [Bryobacteraceae bacterium]